ncbi:TctA family transporter [Cupriavidus necator]|uniref:Putative component of transporter, tripartite tricarboxylate transport (TTT) family n=1 Tax=Cupriavidus necator (strain ATCC 17699 / DSM 428 / KCTC 22496 / NCIMB 10442 / H16 / Stanier 337) TaxID=381666 RepID=Q0K5E5_CUPNH|nr:MULTISPECIES: tripartite tricarboxylate transporter permease [Cupriavidus]EON19340.1 component of transporter, tripartite tricarboxylate transport (TTT) family protein [Cupriavidus sp. GA3-3]EYS95403.1 tripartite tricarboxylate transporter TctA [Cupriavidus sp. SK-4]KUE88194.1 tripartite tricarboxylate transporter TctA [Cupriavidus necator]QCC02508.1 tripartite tricarboxylate transporter permease [Cupriavidus necator H16]QQB78083.1 tripartite tricarboxylate transporter permease [Cupriavidus
MDTLNQLMHGFAVAITPINLMWALVGCFLGTAIGVLPGIGPALTVAMLLPLTAKVEPTAALIMFAGIYYGAMYGGSTTSILMNTPGESSTMVTAMEGNLMAKNGRAGPALATAAIGSFVAGTIATVMLSMFAPVAADVALQFGPGEYFMIMLLAFTTVSAVLGSSLLRGMTALFLGLGIGLIGMDSLSGQTRYSMNVQELYDGIDIVVVAVGLFAVGEALFNAFFPQPAGTFNKLSSVHMNKSDWKRSIPAWIRGTFIGFPFGLIPAGGAEIPTFLSYATEKKLSDHKEDFGKVGAIEGVAGPEAANNAAVTATLAPLLTLGIPTSNTTAILLAAFQNYNLQPGPMLFQTSGDLVWGLLASLYIGNVMLLVLNLPAIGLWVRMLRVPTPLLYGGILIFAGLGAYGIRQSWFDLLLLFVVGLLGMVMRRFDFPTAPVIVGMILGPMAEKQLRNALSIGQGDWTLFLRQPISATILALTVAVVVIPRLLRWHATRTSAHAQADNAA